jgi:SagB-type dehydrogenase family enzyme
LEKEKGVLMKKRFCILVCLVLATLVRAQNIQLSAPQKTGGMPLMEALNARQTQRTFSTKPLSEQQLADLLWAAFGINRDNGKRTAPSARNMQEISLYAALPSGLYLYDAQKNVLTQLSKEDLRAKTGKQPFVTVAPVCLIYVADYDRMKNESEFYSAVDTGYISQNVYFFCASEGLHTVVLGSVDKAALQAAMKLNPAQHIVLTQPVGFPPESE